MGAWLILTVASASALLIVQAKTREGTDSRFRDRAAIASRFVAAYTADFFDQERRSAERELASKRSTADAFRRTVSLVGAEAALLLDGRGAVLQGVPHDPALIGANLTGTYAHLASAVGGTPAASNVVPSAAEALPVVAFAVPIKTPEGRRIFSGAFDIRTTPLAAYLRGAAVPKPNRAYLTDATGKVFATNDFALQAGAQLPDEISTSVDKTTTEETAVHTPSDEYVVSQPIEGTPWRLVIVAPESFLYANIDGLGRWLPWILWAGFVLGGLLSVMLVARLLRRREALAELNGQLKRLATSDSLTGVANRRGMEQALKAAVETSKRYGDSLSVLLLDVDSFKKVNDSSGHAAGDEVLARVAKELSDLVRVTDSVGRWGGDEFVILLPRIDAEGASRLADRVNERIRGAPFVIEGKLFNVTVSIGIAQWRRESADALIDRADQALYAAKSRGRNQSAVAPGSRASNERLDQGAGVPP